MPFDPDLLRRFMMYETAECLEEQVEKAMREALTASGYTMEAAQAAFHEMLAGAAEFDRAATLAWWAALVAAMELMQPPAHYPRKRAMTPAKASQGSATRPASTR